MDFYAYFWNNEVYIQEKFRYSSNEILTQYLNTNYLKEIQEFDLLYELRSLEEKIKLKEDMSYDNIEKYDAYVKDAQSYFDMINKWLHKLPPYNKILKFPLLTLPDLLNGFGIFFEDGLDDDYENVDWNTVNKYGSGEIDENGYLHFRLHYFQLNIESDWNNYDLDLLEELNQMEEIIEVFFDRYISFIQSYISIQNIFRPFIESYLHKKGTFPNENEVAEYFADFNKSNPQNFANINCKMKSFGYTVLKGENEKPILCEKILFSDLQSFLFYDFFNGIRNNYIPNRCKHCGKFFLIRGGKYFSYCDNPLKDAPDKTCRDVGSRRRYDDKCKNDPIWQTYNRAYKAHYARYMKKKMTISEFEKWSRFASDLRDRAIAGEIDFERYYEEIRK